MKKFRLQRLTQPCYLLAVLAGLLLAAAFPRASVAGFAWIAPGLLLFAGMGQGRAKTLRIGLVAGLLQYLTALYWLVYMPVPYVPVLAWLALSGYCALYPALWLWLSWKLFPARLGSGGISDFRALAAQITGVGWVQRMRWAVTCAVLWVALEMILGRFLSGFPWLFLGMSQYQMIPLIQISSLTGIYGVSFVVVWFSVSLLCAAIALVTRPASRSAAMAELALAMLAVAGVSAYGLAQSLGSRPTGETLSVTLVQPSVPQTMIWDPKASTNRFQQLVQLTEEALGANPQSRLLIWPEAAVPGMLRYDEYVDDAVAALAVKHHAWIILGSDDVEPRKGSDGKEEDYFNASFLVAPSGTPVVRYIKRNLVIFGEYVPLVHWLPFLKFLTPIEGGFTPGEKAVPFPLADLKAKTAVLICFEDVFPQLAREYVDEDTDFLVNLTNDGWFNESAEQWQHAANSVFRAVENGLPVVRCANNGITCWIDGHGRMREYRFGNPPSVYGRGHTTIQVPLLGKGEKRALTFYTRHGDWFGWGCVIASVMLLAAQRRRQKSVG